jgi:hypothetical protein
MGRDTIQALICGVSALARMSRSDLENWLCTLSYKSSRYVGYRTDRLVLAANTVTLRAKAY